MKKLSVICLAGILFFAACENNNSSTVGTYENDEASRVSDKKEDSSKEQTSSNQTENTTAASIDTAKNISGVSKDSISSKNKKDTNFASEKKNVKVQKTKKIDTKP